MLKKMRWRFILAAMLAVFIMLVTVLAGINVWNYHTTAERADQRIQEIYGFESGKVPEMENLEENASQPVPPDIFNRLDDHDPEVPYTTRFFIVRLDEEGNVTDVSTDFIASVTQTEAEEFARKVLNEKRQVGYYKNHRFQILAEKNDNIVIFFEYYNGTPFCQKCTSDFLSGGSGMLPGSFSSGTSSLKKGNETLYPEYRAPETFYH